MTETTATQTNLDSYHVWLGRGNGKSITGLVLYCRSLGMTDEEIEKLFEEVWRRMEE